MAPPYPSTGPHARPDTSFGPGLGTTPFHPRTAPLVQGGAWRRWAGCLVASAYALTHEREYAAVRSAAALFDVSPLYKYRVRGPDAVRLLDRVVTRDVGGAPPGRVLYTPWCDSLGQVIEDGTVQRLGEADLRLTTTEPNRRWLELNAVGLDVTLDDESEATAALALQGPLARDIVCALAEDDVTSLGYFRLAHTRIRGMPVVLSRTGYTGDLGYEIWVDRDAALRLWDAVVEAGTPYGLVPAGLIALDIARLEAGLLLLDVDYVSSRRALIEAQTSTPYALGLGWAVALRKAHFVGREALEREQARGPAWRLVGVEVEWNALERAFHEVGLPPRVPTAPWRTSVPLYARGRQIGYATSGCWSPLLKQLIALAHVEAAFRAPGTAIEMEITVEHRRKRASAIVRRLPFFDPERKRACPTTRS